MKKILFINHSDPFAKGGGSYASHAYTKAFADWGQGNIDVCIMAESKCPIDKSIKVCDYVKVPKRSFIERVFSLFTGDIQRYSAFIKKHLKENPKTYGMAVLNGSYEGGALVDICHQYGMKVVTIHHNYDPEFAYDNINIPIYKNVYRHHVYNLQKKAYKKSDINLFLTNEDIIRCSLEFGETKAQNDLLGVFEFSKIPELKERIHKNHTLTFIITGSLCTVQGIDGLSYFFNELYSYLPLDCRIIISGRSPTKEVVDMCASRNNVDLIPNPEVMSEVISSGDVYICPTRVGGGLKLRIMDGLKLGLPVITHKCSARGYDAFNDSPCFQSFSTPEEFGNSVKEIIALYNKGLISPQKVYNKYVNTFSYSAGLNRLKEILK